MRSGGADNEGGEALAVSWDGPTRLSGEKVEAGLSNVDGKGLRSEERGGGCHREEKQPEKRHGGGMTRVTQA